jgi:hypothetical protein
MKYKKRTTAKRGEEGRGGEELTEVRHLYIDTPPKNLSV